MSVAPVEVAQSVPFENENDEENNKIDVKMGKVLDGNEDLKILRQSTCSIDAFCPTCDRRVKTKATKHFSNQALFFFVLCLFLFWPIALCFLCADENFEHKHVCTECNN